MPRAKKRVTRKRTAKKASQKAPARSFTKKSWITPGIVIIVLIIFLGTAGPGSTIETGSTVTLHYIGTNVDGTVFDTSRDTEPLTFIVGEGVILPNFEEALLGHKEGDTFTVALTSDEGYGAYDSEKIGEYPRDKMPEDMVVSVGETIFLESPEGAVGIATITEVHDDVVMLDLNHPLAGKDLSFDVEILTVE